MGDPEENELFKPIWDIEELKEIYPPLHFDTDTAYVGVWLRGRNKEGLVFKPCIITSNKKWFELTPSELELENLYTNTPLMQLVPPRWSYESIQSFLYGEPKEPGEIKADELYKEVRNIFKKYMDMSEKEYTFFTVWTLGTYFYQLFPSYPYIYLNAPKASGKTRLLSLLSLLCFNAEFVASVSTSTLFRIVESSGATLCIDEMEKLHKREFTEFRSILLSGYKKGAYVTRAEERTVKGMKRYAVRKYKVYSPKVLANISGLDDILESRCISFVMKRTKNLEIGSRIIDQNSPIFGQIRDKIYLFLMQNWQKVRQNLGRFSGGREIKNTPPRFNQNLQETALNKDSVKPITNNNTAIATISTSMSTLSQDNEEKKEGMLLPSSGNGKGIRGVFFISSPHLNLPCSNNRDIELWIPLLSVAKTISEDVFNQILGLMKEKIKESANENQIEDTESNLILTLYDLHSVSKADKWCTSGGDKYYPLKNIVSRLKERLEVKEESPYPSNRQVSRLMRSLDFLEKKKIHGVTHFYLSGDKIQEVMNRFNITPDDDADSEERIAHTGAGGEILPCAYCGETKQVRMYKGHFACEDCIREEEALVTDEGDVR